MADATGSCHPTRVCSLLLLLLLLLVLLLPLLQLLLLLLMSLSCWLLLPFHGCQQGAVPLPCVVGFSRHLALW
jgi:hypothetical protein